MQEEEALRQEKKEVLEKEQEEVLEKEKEEVLRLEKVFRQAANCLAESPAVALLLAGCRSHCWSKHPFKIVHVCLSAFVHVHV